MKLFTVIVVTKKYMPIETVVGIEWTYIMSNIRFGVLGSNEKDAKNRAYRAVINQLEYKTEIVQINIMENTPEKAVYTGRR